MASQFVSHEKSFVLIEMVQAEECLWACVVHATMTETGNGASWTRSRRSCNCQVNAFY